MNWNDDRLDHFAEQVEKRFDQIDRRFDHIEARFDALQQGMIITLASLLVAFGGLFASLHLL